MIATNYGYELAHDFRPLVLILLLLVLFVSLLIVSTSHTEK